MRYRYWLMRNRIFKMRSLGLLTANMLGVLGLTKHFARRGGKGSWMGIPQKDYLLKLYQQFGIGNDTAIHEYHSGG